MGKRRRDTLLLDVARTTGRILVHCNKGVSRSPSVVVAYLMKTKELSFPDALQFVQEKRPIVRGLSFIECNLGMSNVRLAPHR